MTQPLLIEIGVEELPAALLQQLKDGGRIAAIFMRGSLGEVKVGYKQGGQISWRFEFNAGAEVMPGFERAPAFSL